MPVRSFALASVIALVAAGPAHAAIVVNEFDYDTVGVDDASSNSQEFVELYNPDSVAQSLAGLTLVFFNGATATNDAYLTVPLSGTILPNGYYTIGSRPGSTLALTDTIQNGAPDSFGIYTGTAPVNATDVNLVAGTGITYEGSNAATPSAFTMVGATFADGDSNTFAASFQRIPNGSGDFMLSFFPTPNAVNSLVPEPATLTGLAAAGMIARRRRRG